MYSTELLDHFEHPRNPGEVADADLVCERTNPVCGDVMSLSARTDGGRVVEIRFLARGCVPVMACASLVTELAAGKTIGELAEINPEYLVERLGGLPEGSVHAAELACDALRGLVASQDASSDTSLRG